MLLNCYLIVIISRNMNNKRIDCTRRAIAELFETNTDAIEVIKLKEIYENFESSLNQCQDVADIIEDIVLKYGYICLYMLVLVIFKIVQLLDRKI